MTERKPSPLTPGTPGAVPPTAVPPVEKAPGEPLGRPPASVPPAAAPAPVPVTAPAPTPAGGPAATAPALSEATARGYESGVTRPPASGNSPRPAADAVPLSRSETRDPGAITTPPPAPPAVPTPPVAPVAPAAPARPVSPPAAAPAPPAATAPATAPARTTAPPRVAGDGVRPAEPLDATDLGRLLDGAHHDPHGLLGAHPVDGGVLFRVLRPYALGVAVSASGLHAELLDEGDGLFAGVLPLREIPEYELLVRYADGEHTVQDPYRFLPSLGELDLHLIGEGRHEQLWHALGAQPMTHQGVTGTRFAVWAPNARGVRIAGGFNFWDGTGFPMRSLGSTGVWELFVPGVGEGTAYKFDIACPDGGRTLKADPMARSAEHPPATASIVTSSQYTWNDAEWMARRAAVPVHQAPFSVYEVHLTSWRPGLTYRELAEQLPAYVADLGFTHVELMPVAEHPFGGSWGYQVTSYYAPTSRMGSPDDFRYLVDALHRAGIGVIMDWVPAHFPKDEWALARFDGAPLYEHGDPNRAEHPDWGTLEFDLGRTEVRNFMVANAVYWCEEFHIDGLRVDAVASMLYLDYSREHGEWTPNEHGGRENLDAVAFLQEMNATVYRRCPGVVTIAEESTAWDGVTRSTDSGGLGFGLKWNMGWMHDSLEYVSKEPVHRKYHHHDMTFSMVYAYSENYVLPISHDEVVHGKHSLVSKMPGDWWQQRATHRAYLGFMWAHPGKQLLFMGQEFAQGAEWSHDHGPDWWVLDETYPAAADHRGVRDLVRELNRTYNATPALWQRDTDPAGFAWIDGGAADDNTFSFLRYDADGEPLVCVSNFSPVIREKYRVGVPDRAWHEVLNTDDARFGGTGTTVGSTGQSVVKPEPTPWHGQEQSVLLTLPPLATVWLRPA